MPAPFARTAVFLGITLGLAGCGRHQSLADAGIRMQTLLVDNNAEPRDFDPQTTTLTADGNIIHGLLEGLCEIDPVDCHPVPGVAESWESNPDGLTWTFHLRADARWSNGDPVTAGDFVYSWHRVLSPALGAEYREQFYCLENAEAFSSGSEPDFNRVGVHAADPQTLVVRLTHPVPYLPGLTTQPPWLPVHRATIEKFGRIDQRATDWTRPANYVGNGAFRLAEWTPGKSVRLTKSSTYWDCDRVRLREVVFYPIENPAVGEAAFRAGQLHIAMATAEKADAYRADPRLAPLLHESALLQTAFYRLNTSRPPLNDVRVRRALSLAINREQLAHRVVHCDWPAFALTPPNCAGYTADRTVRTDVAEAQRLLGEAGFPGGHGFPRIEILFYSFYGTEQPVAEALQQAWRSTLGIEVSVARQEMKTAIAARRTRNYDILSGSWIGDYLDPSTFLDLWRTGNANNATGWSNVEYDRLLAQASRTVEQNPRYDLLRHAESLMLAEAPIIPLYYIPKHELRHPAVRGWHDNLLDLHPLKFVSLAQ